ncbi:MAG: hypothetical protein IIB61_07150, partial [Planctomycetes bacterium]|nr:hypothetical protein [Planctomycetota bacterium]
MTRGKVMVLGLVACVCSAIVVSANAQSARKVLAERTSDDRAATLTVVDAPTADEVAPARAVRPARGGGVAGGCAADILSADPEDLTEDARQPYDPGSGQDEDPALRQGIGSVDEPITLVLSAAGLADDCFALSETAPDGVLGANGIATVAEGPAATYAIVLNHAIAPGAVTTIAVGGDSVAYLAHPSNTNHDGFSNANDVLSTIDMLNGVVPPPFGIYSTDVDHSGAFGAADVLRVIDLLNGEIPYIVWLGVEKPEFPVGPVCGNGIVEEGEECDPPDGVTCDDSCQTIEPGCGDGGDCCIGNGSPGCDNGECCDCICGLDASCCDISWDESCGDNALKFCTVCGGTPPAECDGAVVCGEGDCCDPDGTGTPGCTDQDCCDCICSNDTFCCEAAWDKFCAGAAI